MPLEGDLITLISNQGLAIAISIFLIWWVTQNMGAQLKSACDTQLLIVDRMQDISNQNKEMTSALGLVAERLSDHDKQAKTILDVVNDIGRKV